MKKIILICCLTFSMIGFFSSCMPYYYGQPYGYAPRVVVQPRVAIRSPYYLEPRHHHRGYGRGGYRRY